MVLGTVVRFPRVHPRSSFGDLACPLITCFFLAVHDENALLAKQADCHRIIVRFPRDGTATTFMEANKDLMARFPAAPKTSHTVISVWVNNGSQVEVDGFGLQFRNPSDPEMEGWLNGDKVIFPGVTLRSFLEGDRFSLLMPDELPTAQAVFDDGVVMCPFSYPYGTAHNFDLTRYGPLLKATKSQVPFAAALKYVCLCTYIS